jgi:hypothetical protein
MTRHTIELASTTAAGKALVVVGYQIGLNGPHFFCYLFDSTQPMATPLWNSMFSLHHMHAQDVGEFDEILAQWGVVLPDFIKAALTEDWAKNLSTHQEFCWQADGLFDQIR